jgi:predicted 3-demethylubiquinone-9 3-methyltransferase (glyoxalase superfamily)
MDLIQRAIDKHGAKTVYDAATARLSGNAEPLSAVGLIADDLGVAWAIMRQAHPQMSKAEQAREHWDVQRNLSDINPDGQS